VEGFLLGRESHLVDFWGGKIAENTRFSLIGLGEISPCVIDTTDRSGIGEVTL